MNSEKVFIQIPARAGSKRVKGKNFRELNGKPLIAYAIESSIRSNITKNIFVNTDDEQIKDFVKNNYKGINIYNRDQELASDQVQSDDFTYDFIRNTSPQILITIFPTCPLISTDTIRDAYKHFLEYDADTLISCEETGMQAFCDEKPINISVNEKLQPSQNNSTVKILNWGVTIYDAVKFKKRYDKLGFAALGENRILYKIPKLESFKISHAEDFDLCKKILSIREN